MKPTHYILRDGKPVACGRATWLESRNNRRNFILECFVFNVGITVTTGFVGLRSPSQDKPVFFDTVVSTDLGEFRRISDTFEDAMLMHEMECQRIIHVIERNQWAFD